MPLSLRSAASWMVLMATAVAWGADPSMRLAIDRPSAAVGDEIVATVTLADHPAVTLWCYDLHFDGQRLAVIATEPGGAPGLVTDRRTATEIATSGSLRLAGTGALPAAPATVVARVRLRVLAPGAADLHGVAFAGGQPYGAQILVSGGESRPVSCAAALVVTASPRPN